MVLAGLVSAALLAGVPSGAVAASSAGVDPAARGAIEVSYKGDGTVALYQVAQVVGEGDGWDFRLTDAFADSGVDVSREGIDAAAGTSQLAMRDSVATRLSADLARYVGEQADVLPVSTTPATSGEAHTFAGLEPGLYLVTQAEASDGYQPISPFVAAVLDGSTIQAFPKTARVATSPKVASSAAPAAGVGASEGMPQTGDLTASAVPWLGAGALALGGGIFAGRRRWGRKAQNGGERHAED